MGLNSYTNLSGSTAGAHFVGRGRLIQVLHSWILYVLINNFVPFHTSSSIHVIERRALPEFFNGKNKSKTPEM